MTRIGDELATVGRRTGSLSRFLRDEDRFSLLLLTFSYGVFSFFLLLSLFAADGVSESEEWRIFVFGWVAIPLLAPLLTGLTVRLKRRLFNEVAAFYPALLLIHALFWCACSGFCQFFLWRMYPVEPSSHFIGTVLILFPLLNLALLGLIGRFGDLLSRFPSFSRGVYFSLPLLALLAMTSFRGFHFRHLHLLSLPWAVVAKLPNANEKIAHWPKAHPEIALASIKNLRVSIEVFPRTSGPLSVDLPWHILEKLSVSRWLVQEGQEISVDQPIVEISSENLRAVIRSLTPGVLRKVASPVGVEAQKDLPLCYIEPDQRDADILTNAALWIVILALLSVFHPWSTRISPPGKYRYLLDTIVILLLACILFDPYYSFNQGHYNFYLGPSNDLLLGKSMLVDINCQYGVFVIYFLAGIFKMGLQPLSYKGLSGLISILAIIQYIFIYVLLRYALKSQIFAIVTLGLMVATNFIGQLELITYFPSVGPLRFGLAYGVLGAAYLRGKYVRLKKHAWFFAHAAVGIASIWSVETFFYALATHVGIAFFEQARTADSLVPFLQKAGRKMGETALAIIVCHALLALDIYIRAGEWPHWDRYLAYILLYSRQEFGTLTIPPWSPWAMLTAVYFVSWVLLFGKILIDSEKRGDKALNIAAGMTALGISQFTYFLGRSHPNNLYHVCIPALFLAAYGLAQASGRSSSTLRSFLSSGTYSFYAIVVTLSIAALPSIQEKWDHTAIYAFTHSRSEERSAFSLRTTTPTDPQVEEAMYLMRKYAPLKTRVPLFIDPNLTTETLMLDGRTNLFPLSHPGQDRLVEAVGQRALNYRHGLQTGDFLFLSKDFSQLNSLQQTIAQRLAREFHLQPVESTHSMVALQLQPIEIQR